MESDNPTAEMLLGQIMMHLRGVRASTIRQKHRIDHPWHPRRGNLEREKAERGRESSLCLLQPGAFFFARCCLGKVPGGAPFSQLHKGIGNIVRTGQHMQLYKPKQI